MGLVGQPSSFGYPSNLKAGGGIDLQLTFGGRGTYPELGAVHQRRTSPRSGKVEAIEIHDLVPRSHKVTHKRLLRVVTRVDFRNGSELGVRTED